MDRLIAEVAAKGDPARGEAIFRRADVNCTKCHAVSGAGGGVGPDLSALGSSSPVDYVINSIMLPDQAIKEEFHTLVVATSDGQVFQGIVADKDDKRVVLKEATGELRTVPTSEIEDSKEGGSLMPKGLVNFMTRAEFVDLVRFLSELGKPGPYAVRSTPTIQRWRTLKPVPDALAKSVPDASTFAAQVLNADPARWLPAYARTAGDLPLGELTPGAGQVLYLQGDVEVSHGDKVVVKLNSADGVTAWVDDQAAPQFNGSEFATELPSGRHKLTFRVDTAARGDKPLKAEVLKPPGSSAEYAVLGGR
jgi:putative heme-binding domain-containing protein